MNKKELTALIDKASKNITSEADMAEALKFIRKSFYEKALKAEQMSYIEVHATGSKLGAQVELENLQMAYQTPLFISSVKAHFGHLEPASGLLGLLKAIVVLQHRKVPAQINLTKPVIAPGLLTIAQDHQELPSQGELYAAVSSFGFTGTNSHVVLQSGEFDDLDQQPRALEPKHQVWPLHNLWS